MRPNKAPVLFALKAEAALDGLPMQIANTKCNISNGLITLNAL